MTDLDRLECRNKRHAEWARNKYATDPVYRERMKAKERDRQRKIKTGEHVPKPHTPAKVRRARMVQCEDCGRLAPGGKHSCDD